MEIFVSVFAFLIIISGQTYLWKSVRYVSAPQLVLSLGMFDFYKWRKSILFLHHLQFLYMKSICTSRLFLIYISIYLTNLKNKLFQLHNFEICLLNVFTLNLKLQDFVAFNAAYLFIY